MISLNVQINTLLFSLAYGIFFSLLLSFVDRFMHTSSKLGNLFLPFLFVMGNVLLYFGILNKINNGILHPYSFLAILLGFLLENLLHKKIAFYFKKWYNHQ